VKKKTWEVILVRVEPALKASLVSLAKANRRTIVEQCRIAIEENVAAHTTGGRQ
jgi:hypothetical protein